MQGFGGKAARIFAGELRRISACCAFGRPGSQTDSYIQNMNAGEAGYGPYFRRARRPREAL